MSVVRMKEAQGPQSGGGMDKEVPSRRLSPKAKIGLGAGGLALLLALFWYFMPASNSQTVDAARLTISPVTEGRFDDFLPLRAQVQPSLTVFLDAVEGGRVERILVEDGAMVTQGQALAVLSNSDLQLNVLARLTEVPQQINNMRSQELSLIQIRLAIERARIEADLATQTARRQYEMQRPLAERGFVSGRSFMD
jgi:HlyD family secretion protein